jgi:hypothetical protein
LSSDADKINRLCRTPPAAKHFPEAALPGPLRKDRLMTQPTRPPQSGTAQTNTAPIAAATPTPPQRVIFVGGAPRSGTSVVHALLCTAQACNTYHPEISFVRPVLESYVIGMENWPSHTHAFFSVPEHLLLHVRGLLQQQMTHIAKVLGNPVVLCVKDPLLTPNFAALNAVLGWPAQFITVVRHPYNVVRSFQEVVERLGQEFTPAHAQLAAEEYCKSYAHIEDPSLDGLLFWFRYEDLTTPATLEALRSFTGLPGIDPTAVWRRESHIPSPEEQADPWYSPKYHKPINTENRLPPLANPYKNIVAEICKPLMITFGYS